MALSRGILTTGAGTYGYVQSIEFNENSETLEIKNETGITKVVQRFDKKFEVTVNAKWDRANTLPAIGDEVTLSATPKTEYDSKYEIASISVSEANQDVATLTLNLVRYADGDVPAEI